MQNCLWAVLVVLELIWGNGDVLWLSQQRVCNGNRSSQLSPTC